jgi:hypothetical protein
MTEMYYCDYLAFAMYAFGTLKFCVAAEAPFQRR